MNQPQPDGGPAFPQDFCVVTVDQAGKKIAQSYAECPGMSLRDWFAGMALQGRLANRTIVRQAKRNEKGVSIAEMAKRQAEACYTYADAMLIAREKKA